ncbi:phage head-tail connector protein [Croceibacterium sp. TMG7-5b_MA50]|uniref:head-tail connector protein n=1 Tax=Croceibacterium sp. TMG7-5b_MA50 TaxID=3121290 RepID=UPI003221CEBF
MKRAIVTPADMAGAALDELKSWLAITTTRDDSYLTTLLHAATDMCEAFTGLMPLSATCEEMLAPGTGWQALRTRPVQSILQVDRRDAAGTLSTMPVADYAIDLESEGGGRVRLLRDGGGVAVVRFVAGLAGEWSTLPASLRHGIVRLAADQFEQRGTAAARTAPPACVVALWQPWRRLRLR